MWLPFRSTRLNPAGLVVSSLLFFALGIFAMVYGLIAPVEKRDIAHDAIVCGVGFIGVGLLIAVGFWIARRLTRE